MKQAPVRPNETGAIIFAMRWTGLALVLALSSTACDEEARHGEPAPGATGQPGTRQEAGKAGQKAEPKTEPATPPKTQPEKGRDKSPETEKKKAPAEVKPVEDTPEVKQAVGDPTAAHHEA